jgi:hypothetical protein
LSINKRTYKAALDTGYLKKLIGFWCGCPGKKQSVLLHTFAMLIKSVASIKYDKAGKNPKQLLSQTGFTVD